jgi:photosystem II stability/assembly factor-like uncharacterized protein
MKTILAMLVVLVSCPSIALGYEFGEWRIANTDFSFKAQKIFLVDNDHAWLMRTTSNETVLKNRCPNSSSWCDLKKISYRLNEIFFRTASIGYLVGEGGRIARTPDGGHAWFATSSPTSKELFDVTFYGTNGWAVGDNNTIIHSNDDGRTWTQQDSGLKAKYKLTDVAFVTNRVGWVVGYRLHDSKKLAVILYTKDAGVTWTSQTDNIVGGRDFIPRDITVTQAGWAYIVGDQGAYLMTTDDGKTWNRKDERYGKGMDILAISFGSATVGCYVGTYGILSMTYDAGLHWHMRNQPVNGAVRDITDVQMLSPNLGYATNPWGYVLRYTKE